MPGAPPYKPQSVRFAEEHQRHVAYHERQATEHEANGEPEAAAKHHAAAAAHKLAVATPLDHLLPNAAMRASAMADQISQQTRRGRIKR